MMTLEEELASKSCIIQDRDHQIDNLNNKLEEEKLRLEAIIDNEKNKVNSLEDEISRYKDVIFHFKIY